MANTYSQLYVHLIFAPKGRQNLIIPAFENRLHKYIAGTVKAKGHTLIAINGMADHIHLLVGYKPNTPISQLVRDIKANASKFLNQQGRFPWKFEWQAGYGCFSCGHNQIPKVANYIDRQKEHHRTTTFQEEFLHLLQSQNIPSQPEFLFEFYR